MLRIVKYVKLLLLFSIPAVIFVITGCQTNPQLKELAETYYNLGNAYVELEEWDKAETAYARSLEIEPEMYRAEYNMARVHIHSKDYKSAITILKKLLIDDPKNVVFLETLAWADLKSGQVEKAESIYRSLLREDPANCNVRYNLAVVLSNKDQYNEAYSILIECVYTEKADAEIFLTMGEIEKKLEWGSGVAWFEKASQKEPRNEDVLIKLSAAYEEEEEYTDALDTYKELLTVVEENKRSDFLYEQARLLFLKLEEFEEGQNIMSSAFEKGFNNIDKLAELYIDAQEQNLSGAVLEIEESLRQNELIEAVLEAVDRKRKQEQQEQEQQEQENQETEGQEESINRTSGSTGNVE